MDCPSYMYRYRGRLVKRHEHYSYATPSLLFINSLLPLSPNSSNSPLFHPHVSLFPFLFTSHSTSPPTPQSTLLKISPYPSILHTPTSLPTSHSILLQVHPYPSASHLFSTHLPLYPPLSPSLSLHLTPPLHPPPTLSSLKSVPIPPPHTPSPPTSHSILP